MRHCTYRWIALLIVILVGFSVSSARERWQSIMMVPGYDITTWPDAPFRMKDIATNLYADEYRASYEYGAALVSVDYHSGWDHTFRGYLSAENLKPNFAYQIKLVGKPEALWGAEGDDVANEKIGYTGRWWRNQPTPGNSSDSEYEAHQDDPDWIFEGYLLFDFFITDHLGRADLNFAMDSSLHVLWWEHQRAPGICDSPVLWHTVLGHAEDPAYEIDLVPIDLGVYAEIERLCYGESQLPVGFYNCRLLITEESFHQSGENEGYWASALVYDEIGFEIVDITDLDWEEIQPKFPSTMYPNPFRERSRLSFTLPSSSSVRLLIYDIKGRECRCIEGGELPEGSQVLSWDGRDQTGRKLPGGVYLYRLDGEGFNSRSGKLVLMR